MPDIPSIEAAQVEGLIADVMPEASISTEIINSAHRSWRIEIAAGERRFAIVWGPISGFGGIDYSSENNDPFAHCDEYLWSLEDARNFLTRRKETNEAHH